MLRERFFTSMTQDTAPLESSENQVNTPLVPLADYDARIEPIKDDRLTCVLAIRVVSHSWIATATATEPEKQSVEISAKKPRSKGDEQTNQAVKSEASKGRRANKLTCPTPKRSKAQLTRRAMISARVNWNRTKLNRIWLNRREKSRKQTRPKTKQGKQENATGYWREETADEEALITFFSNFFLSCIHYVCC